MEACPYTCTDGACPELDGNDSCQDEKVACAKHKEQVHKIPSPFHLFREKQYLVSPQGDCEPSSANFKTAIDKCHYTCTGGECPGYPGNDDCSDRKWDCPRWNYLVRTFIFSAKFRYLYFFLFNPFHRPSGVLRSVK